MSMKNSSDTIGNRTRNLPVCSTVPEPTAPPHAPYKYSISRVSASYFGEEGKITELVMRVLHAMKKCNPSYEKHLSFIIGSWRGTLPRQFVSLRVNEPIKATVTPELSQIKSSSKQKRGLCLSFLLLRKYLPFVCFC